MTTRAGINGFDRIGHSFFHTAFEQGADTKIAAVNDLINTKTPAHLFKYDSILGRFGSEVFYDEPSIIVNGRTVKVLVRRSSTDLSWGRPGIDVVVKSTGFFTDGEKVKAHPEAGARKVIISIPTKSVDGTFVTGTNGGDYGGEIMNITSNTSCTTNCSTPLTEVLHANFGVIRGIVTTIHFYTGDQCILDVPYSDLCRACTAVLNMIPTRIGAAQAVALVPPEPRDKFDGLTVRVPTPTGSLIDLTFQAEKEVSVEVVNAAVKAATEGELKGILEYTEGPVVSINIVGDPYSPIFDAGETKAISDFVKVLSRYDSERGHSNRFVQLAILVGSKLT